MTKFLSKKILLSAAVLVLSFLFFKISFADVTANMVAHYRMDETSGATAADSSGNGNNGTVSGGAAFSAGKLGNALNFDGVNDYVALPRINANEISLSLWFYRNAIDAVNQDFLYGGASWPPADGSKEGYTLRFQGASSENLVFNLATTNGSAKTARTASYIFPPSTSIGGWHHIAGTYDSSTGVQSLFIDGQLRNTQAHPAGNTIVPLTSLSDTRIGDAAAHITNGYWNGLIDEVRIYSRVLSAADITELYNYTGASSSSSSSQPPIQNPPSVVTNPTTSITTSSATLNSTVNPNGQNSSVWFEYGLTSNPSSSCSANPYGNQTSIQTRTGSSDVAASSPLSSLSSNTLYYYRAAAENPSGRTCGAEMSFRTAQIPPTSGYTCTQVIGFSQSYGWFPFFEQTAGIENNRWELLGRSGAAIEMWMNPNYQGWTNSDGQNYPASLCSTNSNNPDRVILTITSSPQITPQKTTPEQWATDIRAVISTIRTKYSNIRQIVLQPLVGGPNHQVCQRGTPLADVRASANHPIIDQAIALVVGGDVIAGYSPEVNICSEYIDNLGHLTPTGYQAVAAKIANFYSSTLPSDTITPTSPSITINNGAASTNTTGVTLNLSASDNVGVVGYYVSENSSTPTATQTGWVPVTSMTNYSATVSFTLSSGNGVKTVYAWYKDAAENVSAMASDGINYISGTGRTYYIDPAGDDSKSGLSELTPWRTISRVNSSTFSPGDSVLFKRGGVWREELIILSSGTVNSHITFGAYGTGDKPIINGSKVVSGWDNYGGNIYSADISSLNLSRINQLLVDGNYYDMAHYPNNGYLNIDINSSANNYLIDNDLTLTQEQVIGSEIMIRIRHWQVNKYTVSSYNPVIPRGYRIGWIDAANYEPPPWAGYGYYLRGKLWMLELDTAKGWYYDSADGKIYIRLENEDNPSSHTVEVSGSSNGIRANNRSYVDINDIVIKNAGANGIYLSNSSNNIQIQNIEVYNSGEIGLLAQGTQSQRLNNITIQNSKISNSVESGIETRVIDNSKIENNEITNTGTLGQRLKDSHAGIGVRGSNNIVKNNKVFYSGHRGIGFYDGENNHIQNNFVDNSCLKVTDCGGIYTWGNPSKNSRIIGNIVMNSLGSNDGSAPFEASAKGIYLDGGVSNMTVKDNTVINVTEGIQIRGGADTINNNTVFKARNNALNFGSQQGGAYVTPGGSVITNNNFFNSNNIDPLVSLYSSFGSGLNGGDGVDLTLQEYSKFDYNNYFQPYYEFFATLVRDGYPKSRYVFSEWQSIKSQDPNSKDISSFYEIKPISNDPSDDMYIHYNTDSVAKTINLQGQKYCDVNNNVVEGSITLEPYSSKILLSCFNNNDGFCNNRETYTSAPGEGCSVSGDSTDPAIIITSPTTNATYSTTQPTINISGSASDNVGVTSVTWRNSANNTSGTAVSAANWTNWSVANISLALGSNPITVTVKDAAGNTGTDIITVTYASTAVPSVTTNTAINITNNSATLRATVNPNNLSTTAYFEYGLSATSYTAGRTPNQTLTGSSNISINANTGAVLAPNTTYHFRAVAQNLLGTRNGNDQFFTTLQIADIIRPASPSIIINNGAASTNSTNVNLRLSASDNVGVVGYYISQSPTTPSATQSGWTSVTSAASYSDNVSFTLSSGNGVKTVYAWYKDVAGNISTRASDGITLNITDTTPPTGSITINDNVASTNTTSVTLNLSATDNIGVNGYYVSESSTIPSATQSDWTSVTSAASYSDSVSFALSSGEGTKNIYVFYKDAAGNISDAVSVSIVFKLPDGPGGDGPGGGGGGDTNNPPGPFKIKSPSHGDTITNDKPTFSWETSSDSDLSQYQIYLDGELVQSDIKTTSFTANDSISCGDHSWFVRAIDQRNNKTDTISSDFTRDCDDLTQDSSSSAPFSPSSFPIEPFKISRTLSFGSTGNEVKRLQEILKSLGFFPASQVITEYFGLITKDALIKYQKSRNIEPDGIVKQSTVDAINKEIAIESFSPTQTSQYYFKREFGYGSKGDDVAELQKRLISEGVYNGPITGYFGPLTREGVKKYQAKNNLPPVGAVGPKTLALLNKTSSVSSSQGFSLRQLVELLISLGVIAPEKAELARTALRTMEGK